MIEQQNLDVAPIEARTAGRPAGEGNATGFRPTTTKRRNHMSKLLKFVRSESGATAIEYGLIAALIAVVIIAGLTLVGGDLNNMFNNVASKI
jgi:pilus assembly protein Flp/PilA